ncbi:hypothetical protein L9F63_012363, partial [Diploptera punctata]
MTTSLRKPQFSPEIANLVTIVSFQLTDDGLMDQLLGIALNHEAPHLESERSNIIMREAEYKRVLKIQEQEVQTALSATEDIMVDFVDVFKALLKCK